MRACEAACRKALTRCSAPAHAQLYVEGVEAAQRVKEEAQYGRLPVKFWDELATPEVSSRTPPADDSSL